MKKLLLTLAFIFILVFACTACDSDTIPDHIHTYGEWETTKEPTCTEEGARVRHCACLEQESEPIPATGHSYGDWVTEEATCAKTGSKHRDCAACGNSVSETIPVNPDAHNYATAWTSDDTEHWHICSNSGCASISNKTTHTEGDWIVDKEPLEDETGVKHTQCTVCAKILKEESFPTYSAGLAYKVSDGGVYCAITGIGTCKDVEIFIPPNIDGYIVTSISDGAFINCDNLTSVTIPNSVTSIDRCAFYECTGLTSVTFGENSKLTSIGDGAFRYCYQITSIDIPDSVTSIGDGAFGFWLSLTSINIPDSVMSIGVGTFYYCIGFTSIIIPDSVTSIDDDAFQHCESLASITIPSSVTSIGDDAFRDCTNLANINFGGTKDQWNSISKGRAWNYDTPTITVTCTDGTIIID